MARNFAEIAFTENVKSQQEKMGSRRSYARIEAVAESSVLGVAEKRFISERDHFYLATVGETGYPYIQHRGGPKGFLKAVNDRTLGFADFKGNLQYVSLGNLTGNDRAALFLVDYVARRRLKIYARTEIVDMRTAPELMSALTIAGYPAVVERGFLFHVEAYDWNCPQHITPRYTLDELEDVISPMRQEITRLENQLAAIKAGKGEWNAKD